MAQELELASIEQPPAEDAKSVSGCPVLMGSSALSCGRALHDAPPGVDKEAVCLMHSKDIEKQDAPLYIAFEEEIFNILKCAGDGDASYEGFIFPGFCWAGLARARCIFDDAVFTQQINFKAAMFARGATFNCAQFVGGALFHHTKFAESTDFSHVEFKNIAAFSFSQFDGDADFSGALFSFEGGTNSWEDLTFYQTIFKLPATFRDAVFAGSVTFREARFEQEGNFSGAQFLQEVDFGDSNFKRAEFAGTTFSKNTSFSGARFDVGATWEYSQFLESAAFRGTRFNGARLNAHSYFYFANFARPGEVVFDETDLSKSAFLGCDVSDVCFTPSVRWGRTAGRKAVLFEENAALDLRDWLKRNGERDYRAIAQTYQQLKKNYDARLDYWTANEFHFGEMEMQRMAAPTEGPLLPLRRWWHRTLSLVAWYRYASDYGNSFTKPLYWLAGVLLLFALMFPLPGLGLQQVGKTYVETYVSAWRAAGDTGQHLWWIFALFLKGLLTAIDTAVFQKSPEFATVNPLGHALATAEMLLTSTLFALFLLAIRRQFRR